MKRYEALFILMPRIEDQALDEKMDKIREEIVKMGGKVDAAVVSDYALTASCAVDFAKPEDFRTIATTEKMPLTSLMVDTNKVSAADAARLQQALLAISGDKVPADLTGKGFVAPVSWKPAAVEAKDVPSPAKP